VLLHVHARSLPYDNCGNAGQNDDKTIRRCQNDDKTVLDMDVPQVSLKLVFRGEELPRLHSIRFISGSDTCIAEAPQDRDLAKAVAVALLLFRAYSACPEMTLFRIRAAKTASFIDTIRNAKKQSQSKSPICALANGAFLRLFLKPYPATGRYVDIDLARLKPAAIEVVLDGRVVSDPRIIKQMTTLISARKSWDLNDYSIEALPQSRDPGSTASKQQNPSSAKVALTERTASPTVLDNSAFIASRQAARNCCPYKGLFALQVGRIRSRAELEDLWEIDNAAYGEASITYEKFQDWWFSYPSGLHALFFRTRVMGAIGIWPLSAHSAGLLTTGRLKESQLNGRVMRTFINASTQFWYISGIVLRSELIGGRAIKILLSHGIGSWLASAHIHFPCELLALAYSEQGQALLEGFDFFKLQNAKAMPDRVPLFALQVSDREQLLSSLKSRGLDPCPPANKLSN
jgi:hypothetical protein